MKPIVMFWLCLVAAVLNLAETAFVVAQGGQSWAGVFVAAVMILLAWSWAVRVPPEPPQS